MYLYIHCSTIHSDQNMETTKCPSIEDWIKKMWYTYTLEYYSVLRKDEILSFATTQMDLENIRLSKISQSEKVKNHMILLTCGI